MEIQPGWEQRVHQHPPKQVYFILEGSGLMTVGDESQKQETRRARRLRVHSDRQAARFEE
jgi:oxalate decarboxylase/phosphoglucose isomerase-like protein (cupin superfamily)